MSVKLRGGPVPPSMRSAEGGPINGIGEQSLFFSFFFFSRFLPSSYFAASRFTDQERVRPPTLRRREDVVVTNTVRWTAGVGVGVGAGGQPARNCSRGLRCSIKKKKKRGERRQNQKGNVGCYTLQPVFLSGLL